MAIPLKFHKNFYGLILLVLVFLGHESSTLLGMMATSEEPVACTQLPIPLKFHKNFYELTLLVLEFLGDESRMLQDMMLTSEELVACTKNEFGQIVHSGLVVCAQDEFDLTAHKLSLYITSKVQKAHQSLFFQCKADQLQKHYHKKMTRFVIEVKNYFENVALPHYCHELQNSNHKCCVIFDIDGVLLDPDNKCQAICAMHDLYHWIASKNIAIFSITARLDSSLIQTIKQLIAGGFNKNIDTYHMPETQFGPLSCYNRGACAPAWKEFIRKELTDQGYVILATFDDQKPILYNENGSERGFLGVPFLVPDPKII